MEDFGNKLWVWGYVMDKIPGFVPFVNEPTSCSLETACRYLGADNAVFMNSMHDIDALDDGLFSHLRDRKNVVCGLTHGKYAESAERISAFSLTHPNVCGAVLDDFKDHKWAHYSGPSADMTPEELKEIRDCLRKHNPALKLYVVRYTWQDPEEILPFVDFFDVLNLWVWTSTEAYWNAEYRNTIARLDHLYHKPILQGIFLHHYGLSQNEQPPMPPDLLRLQCDRVSYELASGHLMGWMFLQNGWFSLPSHRETVLAAKESVDWFYGTTTLREE